MRVGPLLVLLAAGAVLSLSPLSAQDGRALSSAEPFKLGTFEIGDVPQVGIVLRDALVVELAAANRALERNPVHPRIPMPDDMLELIGRYDYGLRLRLYEIVNDLVAGARLEAGSRPAYVHDVGNVRTLPPGRACVTARAPGAGLRPPRSWLVLEACRLCRGGSRGSE
jgi:hypothetical protein